MHSSFCVCMVVGIKPQTSHTLGSCCTTEPHLQPDALFLYLYLVEYF